VTWAVFPPLAAAAVFSAVDLGRMMGGDSKWNAVPYPAFAFSGLVFWAHFSQSVTSGTASVALARDMLHKSKFPAELLPLAKILALLLDLAIGMVLLVALLLLTGRSVSPCALLVPVVFVLQLMFTAGVALFFSALNVFFRDVHFVLQALLPVLMFASDVVVPVGASKGTAATVLALNPLVSYLGAYRELLLLGRVPEFPALLPGLVGAFVALGGGLLYFRRVAPRFPEEV
jgi:ABC-type polysaccharide/polyol phosphate export permease